MNDFEKTGTAQYSQFIHLSRYSRWLEKENRRETWDETVQRYVDFWIKRFPEYEKEISSLKSSIKEFKVMPSMRALMTAGPALEKDEVAGYNCAFVAIDNQKAFDEILYILMCGTGVGFSVERQYISELPEIAEQFYESETTIIVPDSKKGWASSFRELISLLYMGKIPKWDLSRLRPEGAKLKTFGGRSSGPEPLNQLFKFSVNLFKKAAGRKLTSIECHDLVCKIAEIVVVGGVRRSALLSLSNLSDDRLRDAKAGQWWIENPQRQLSNNSAAYADRPDLSVFLNEWISLYKSKSGERGIFSKKSAQRQAQKSGRRDGSKIDGTNPCSEILLRSAQFCNLTEVIAREGDTLEDLLTKVEAATILGTLQSTLTDFKYLRKVWQKNTEEERLLGVSLTGIMDHHILGQVCDEAKEWSKKMEAHAIEVNKKWASKLGIEQSAAITCVKPSGTVSQLVNSSSGIHARYADYYIRRVRIDKKDPLCTFMTLQGFPGEQDVMNPNAWVFEFPIKSPDSSRKVKDLSAIDQLEIWKQYQDYWCEHKPSCTIYYNDKSFMEVGAWVWKNFDEISGLSFLPSSDHVYKQAPYEEISKEKYEELEKQMPRNVDWTYLSEYEKEDSTTSSKELACSAGICEVVDLV